MATRPDNDAYFMNMAKLSATRSTCLRRSVGAVIVKEKRILTTGYNGAPRGIKHCEETGCVRLENHIESGTRHELCRGVHAEQNAKILINAGIKEVIYLDDYVDTLSREILEESNVLVRRYVENK